MTLIVIPDRTTWGSIRNAINQNTNEVETRLQSLEVAFSMLSGDDTPNNALGNNGDYYIKRSNHTLWRKVNGVWVEQNSLVGPIGLTNRGEWASGTTYSLRDAVAYKGHYWLALRTNIGVEPNTVNTSDWSKIASGLNPIAGNWSSATTYDVNDMVQHRDVMWRAVARNTNSEPLPGNGNWQAIARGLREVGSWSSATTYHRDDVVLHRSSTWRSVDTSTNQEPTTDNTANWSRLSAGFHTAGLWTSATPYRVNDIVRHGGSSYRVLTNHTSSATTPDADTTNYIVIAQKGDQGIPGLNVVPRGNWSNTTAYAVGDLVRNAGSQWRAIAANTGVTPVEGANWTLFLEGATPATTSQKGTARLTTAPADVADPLVVSDTDPRNNNARTPTAHVTTHGIGGADALPAASDATAGLARRAPASAKATPWDNTTDFMTPEFHATSPPIGFFYAGRSAPTNVDAEDQSLTGMATNLLQFNSAFNNIGGWYSTTTFRYTPQRAGLYLFYIHVQYNQGGNGYWDLGVRKNATNMRFVDWGDAWGSKGTGYTYFGRGGFTMHALSGTTDYVEFLTYVPIATAMKRGEGSSYVMGWYIGPS